MDGKNDDWVDLPVAGVSPKKNVSVGGADDWVDIGSSTPSKKTESAVEKPKEEPGIWDKLSNLPFFRSGKAIVSGAQEAGESFMQGARGAELGALQLAEQAGINPLPFENKDYARVAKQFAEEEKPGVINWAARQAGNPLMYQPWIKALGVAPNLAIQSGTTALLTPSEREDQTIAGRVGNTALSTITGFLTGKTMSKVGAKVAESLGLKGAVEQVTTDTDPRSALQWVRDFVKDKPVAKTTKEMQSAYNAAKKAGYNVEGKTPEEIWKGLQNWYQTSIDNMALEQSKGIVAGKTDPLLANLAINEGYDKVRALVSSYYDDAAKIGSAEKLSVEDFKTDMSNAIGELSKKSVPGTNPKFDSALNSLKSLYDELESKSETSLNELLGVSKRPDIEVDANWLAEVKRTLNELYKPATTRSKADLPIVRLSEIVRDSIKKTSPQFQTALNKADIAHSEQMRMFHNDIVKKFWDPEKDYDAWKAVFNSGRSGNLNPEVKARAEQILNKIKNPSDLEALKEVLPPQYYDSVRGARMHQIMNESGIDAKTLNNNYDLLKASLDNDPKAQVQLDGMKSFVEEIERRKLKELTPDEMDRSDKIIERGVRSVLSFGLNHYYYAMKHAQDAIMKKNTLQGERLLDFAEAMRGAAPTVDKYVFPRYTTGPAGVATEGAARAVATSTGETIGERGF